MKLTSVISKLKDSLDTHGDYDVLSFKIVDEHGSKEWFLTNPKTGKRVSASQYAKMIKEEEQEQEK